MVFDRCELRASGFGHGFPVPGLHSCIQQYRLGNLVKESLEAAAVVSNGWEGGIEYRGNDAVAGGGVQVSHEVGVVIW